MSSEAVVKANKLKKKHKKNSLSIRVQEIEKYDWNPSMRFLLLILVLGTRREKEDYSDTFLQEDCPWSPEEMVGWCDMTQWRLAGRVGLKEDRICEMLAQLEEDGFILIEGWTDENHKEHRRYKVVEAVVDENQRPEQSPTMKRGKRYSKPRTANKGSFSKINQPKISALKSAIMEEDDETI